VLQKHGKALVIYGAAHFYRTLTKDYLSSMGDDIGIASLTFALRLRIFPKWAEPAG
jgi:hypothetical protein